MSLLVGLTERTPKIKHSINFLTTNI